MTQWLRYAVDDTEGFGSLSGDEIQVHSGDLFQNPQPTGETLKRSAVKLLTPCQPSMMICLWNNFHALAAKLGVAEPQEPLYFLKAPSAYLAPGEIIRRPSSYDGPVVYEGELGIVIGKSAYEISESEAKAHILGYTCVNDVTAAKLINKDATFAQWTRAKSFPTFGVFGPVIATDVDPAKLSIKTVLNGDERQNYPLSDMIFSPARLVSMVSHDMRLSPGDVIACGTSLGVGSMKEKENSIEITIEGIGTLSNTFVQ
jgi:2-keto-4-pentenoate hydratase/2-oxohepta-3-ene-1,7-dioic acid hydratase in catechol pathway